MRPWGLPAWLVRATVRLLVTVMVASSAAPVAHTLDRHDADCFTPVVVHDASQHRIGADEQPAPSAADHCAACHLARAFARPGLEATTAPALVAASPLQDSSASIALAQLDLRVPARAPPARV